MKRNLILTFLACGACALLTTGALAQTPAAPDTAAPATTGTMGGEAPADGAHPRVHLLAHLTRALGLTGSQQAQIAPILEAAQPQLKAIRDQAQAARQGVIQSVSAQITPLLTGTQQERFAKIVQHLEESPGPGGPASPGHAHPGNGAAPAAAGKGKKLDSDNQLQHLTTALNLTPAEQTQIKPILQAAHTKARAVFQNTSLTPQQKFAQVKDAMQAANAQINGILTPDQQTKFGALRQERLHRGRGKGPHAAPSASPSASPSA